MIKDDSSYSTRVHAWFHTAIVSAGPWIISIITINLILAFSKRWNLAFVERELLISAIIYSTLFSQILTAPFQMVVTRYIADRIYKEEYEYIKPSFWGVAALISILSIALGIWFYRDSELPIEFLYLCVALTVVLSCLWILIVYQSTLKNFKLVTMSNILGTFVTFALILFLANNPLSFNEFSGATNLLLAYLGGIVFFTLFLLIAFLSEMKEDNGKIFHFIRYFHSEPSLWPIGLLYSVAIWIDNILMWFSPISVQLFGLYRYAPYYDVATFYSYLTILPSTMLFMVLIETDFYVKCREFFLAVLRNGPYSELKTFGDRMWQSLQRNILQTFEIQLFITIIIIILSKSLFPLLNVPEGSRQIFVIYALGAFCNSFILIFMQVLLYIGERNRTLFLMVIFLVTNVVFTLLTLALGESYYGFGFFLSAFVTMLVGLYMTYMGYKRVIQHTYMTQPVYTKVKNRPFERLEEWIDKRLTDQDALDKLVLEKRRKKAIAAGIELDELDKDFLEKTEETKEPEDTANKILLSDLFAAGEYVVPEAEEKDFPEDITKLETAYSQSMSLSQEEPLRKDAAPIATEGKEDLSPDKKVSKTRTVHVSVNKRVINPEEVIEDLLASEKVPPLGDILASEEKTSDKAIEELLSSEPELIEQKSLSHEDESPESIIGELLLSKDDTSENVVLETNTSLEELIAAEEGRTEKGFLKDVSKVSEMTLEELIAAEAETHMDELGGTEVFIQEPELTLEEFIVDENVKIIKESSPIEEETEIKTYTGIILEEEEEQPVDDDPLKSLISSYLKKEEVYWDKKVKDMSSSTQRKKRPSGRVDESPEK